MQALRVVDRDQASLKSVEPVVAVENPDEYRRHGATILTHAMKNSSLNRFSHFGELNCIAPDAEPPRLRDE
jgi:hypothetical protein